MADVSLGYQMVVNKKHALPSTYAPGEDPTAGAQVKKLIQKMQELEYPISDVYSGYRSYEYQEQLITIMSLVKAKRLRIRIPQDLATANIKPD